MCTQVLTVHDWTTRQFVGLTKYTWIPWMCGRQHSLWGLTKYEYHGVYGRQDSSWGKQGMSTMSACMDWWTTRLACLWDNMTTTPHLATPHHAESLCMGAARDGTYDVTLFGSFGRMQRARPLPLCTSRLANSACLRWRQPANKSYLKAVLNVIQSNCPCAWHVTRDVNVTLGFYKLSYFNLKLEGMSLSVYTCSTLIIIVHYCTSFLVCGIDGCSGFKEQVFVWKGGNQVRFSFFATIVHLVTRL